MADFGLALPVILRHEGGERFTLNKHDRGGATKWGITQRTLRAWRGRPTTVENVRQLTREEAEQIYRARYWDACRCGEIRDQTLATKIFDIAVNCGVGRAVRMVQQAINVDAVRRRECSHELVNVDGIIGPETLWGLDQCDLAKCIKELKRLQVAYYLGIIKRDPTQRRFQVGWLKRAAWPGRDGTS